MVQADDLATLPVDQLRGWCEVNAKRFGLKHVNEKDEAIALANRVLERINADPDDDLSILARQFLRSLELPALPRDHDA